MALQRGRVQIHHPEVSDIRELTRADLTHLQVPRPQNLIQNLRDSHHRVARAVAAGLTGPQISASCGISNGSIARLKGSPAFQELVAHYRSMLTDHWIENADPVIELLGSIRNKALSMIEDKLDDAADKNEFLPSRDLATFAELGADRTNYGKVSKNLNINVDFAAKLESARKRSSRARDITPMPPSSPIAVPPPGLPQSALVPTSAPANRAPRPSILRRV